MTTYVLLFLCLGKTIALITQGPGTIYLQHGQPFKSAQKKSWQQQAFPKTETHKPREEFANLAVERSDIAKDPGVATQFPKEKREIQGSREELHKPHVIGISIGGNGNLIANVQQVSQFEDLVFSHTYHHSSYLPDSNFVEAPTVQKTLTPESKTPVGVWIANGIGAFMVITALAIMKLVDEESPVLRYCSIVCYLVFSILIDTNIGAAGNGNGFNFEPACAVLLVEIGKLVTSIFLYTVARWEKVCDGQPYLQETFQMQDAIYLAIPGFLFALSNVLVYFSLGHNDIASFGVFRDTIIFFNAGLWCFVYKATLGVYRNLGLVAIFAGLCINQVTPLMNNGFSPMILLVLLMAFTNACASVANEYAIKQNSRLDLNLQNAVLYCFCIIWAIIYLVATKPEKLSSFGAFFENFNAITFLIIGLQLNAGLLLSRILKYADSITKNVACCLRGPILIVLAPAVGLHSRLDFLTGLSSIIVCAASYFFLMQGKPAVGIDLDATPNADKPNTDK